MTTWIFILLVLTSPVWGTVLFAWVDFKIRERRCAACKGLTAAITAIGPDFDSLCHYHEIHRRIIERKEREVLGEWPNVR